MLCYTLQIFCDFSGYTDMAIGIALLLGFRLCLNFDSPYRAINITQFWRKWHISLSSWLRDYVYIPLGGNRRGVQLQFLFLFMTMLIGGFWHGASWKFVFWGAGHGILLALHKVWMRYVGQRGAHKLLVLASWALTFLLVALLWVPFRAETMSDAWLMYVKMVADFDVSYFKAIGLENPLLMLIFIGGYIATLLPSAVKEFGRLRYERAGLILKMAGFALVIQAYLQIKSSSVQPFIYFQF
jgi:D-alanyl-lipoteichoic acid acyltransferase DltB (MBOAT superfamily)